MRTAPILARIRAMCPAFKQVGHALTSAAQNAYPAAFVSIARVSAQRNETLGTHLQPSLWTVRVFVTVERRQDDAFGQGVADELDDCLAQLRAALVGWSPDLAADPFNFAGGELADRGGLACWAEDYTATILMRF